MKRLTILFAVLAVFLWVSNVTATPVIDGAFGLSEWAGYYADDDGVGSGGYVGPGWGGQAFDAEYLGLYMTGSQVYFGLQTGFNLKDGVDYSGQHYTPGDFFIDFGSNGSWDVGIDFSISGAASTYSIYLNPNYDDPSFSSSTPWQVTSGQTPLGNFTSPAGYGTSNDGTDDHYVLEGLFSLADYVGLSAFIGQAATIHWTMSCGNDVLEQTSAPVPEPATMLLFGTGLIGLVAIGRKRFPKQG